MYIVMLTLHNLTRWLVIIFAILALVRAWGGWLGHHEWTDKSKRIGMIYTIVLDLQVLFGLILYIFPGTYTRYAFGDIGSAMQNVVVRFFAFEHIFLMLVAVAIAHIARSVASKAANPTAKYRRLAIWLTVSLAIILAAIPWPFFPDYGRPLFRFFGLL